MDKIKNIYTILILGFAVRLIFVMSYCDFNTNYYWEYGEIAKNLIHDKGYSLFYTTNNQLMDDYSPDVNPEISAYMPPGFVVFLVPYLSIDDIPLRNALLYLSNIIISLFVIVLIYKLTHFLVDENTALMAALITALLPEFIFSVSSFTPTILYHCFVLLLFLQLSKLDKNSINQFLLISFIATVIIYLRSEFLLFVILLGALFIYQKKYRRALITISFVILLVAPWTIRNYLAFDKFVPMTNSFGINLYRGNNPYGLGVWGDKQLMNKIVATGREDIELKMNQIYLNETISYVKKNPDQVMLREIEKFAKHWIFDFDDTRTYNLLYILPHFFILCSFIFGMVAIRNHKKFEYLYLFLTYSTIVILIFFPMTRYQTMMKIAMIPFTAFGIFHFYKVVFKKN